MKRFLLLMLLSAISLPVGFSIAGCAGTNPNNYCVKNGAGYGLRIDQVAAILLQPATTGISLGYGQTSQLQAPTATNCNGGSESVSQYTYGSNQKGGAPMYVVDVSPNGALCGGTWNRTSPGGIADYTICTPPTPAAIKANCASGSICVALLTASGAGVTSNTVAVYVHPPVSQIQLSVAPPANDPKFTGCFSQNQTSQLDATAFISGTSTPFCSPAGNTFGVPDCSTNLGHFVYTPVNPAIVTIDQNGVATAHQPGSTAITASISNVSSTAGYFPTCPPASISLKVASNGSNSAVVTPGTPVPLTTVITDTQGNQITGVSLDYSSTNPQEISVGANGSVTTTFPSVAAITATCNPPTCNPSTISQIGVLGNGLPIVSNSVDITSTGRNSTYLWMASPQSSFFEAIDLNTGTIAAPIKLPYKPNSMVLDQAGTNLYFGNYRELMVYSAPANALTKEITSVPGVVLAVSPDSSTVVIADQLRQVIYLYANASGAYTSIGGLGTRAAFTPDGKTLYVNGPDALYVHNLNTGWSVYPNVVAPSTGSCTLAQLDNSGTLPFCPPDVAVTTPGVGAFLSGSPTTARSFCYNTSNSTASNPPAYPQAALLAGVGTDHLTATTDGKHILGANTAQLTDISLGTGDPNTAPTAGVPTGACPAITAAPLTFPSAANALPLPVTPTAVDQVVASPDSTIAFVTYTLTGGGPGAALPAYKPSATFNTPGALSNVSLSGAATAPLAGIFSPDNSTFFVGTAGDNLVHFVDVPSLTDTKTINPGLTDPTGVAVPVQFFAVKPRPTT